MVDTSSSSSASSSRSSSSEGFSSSISSPRLSQSPMHAERSGEGSAATDEASTSGSEEVQEKRTRASNRQRYGPSDVPGYEWVNGEVTSYYSRYQDTKMITNLLDYTNCLNFDTKENPYPIGIRSCRNNAFVNPDLVCLDQSDGKMPSFYMYDCLLRDLKVTLPFDEFTMGVLRVLNVAPTQLHPNSWAQLQGFKHLCKCLHIKPSPLLFLYFYSSRPTILAKWHSLSRIGDRLLLNSFTSSYKNFKTGFFRVTIRPNGQRFFFDGNGQSLFPLYWTRTPRPYDVVPKKMLTAEERTDLKLLMRLPRRLPTRSLINLIVSPRWWTDLIGMLFVLFFSNNLNPIDVYLTHRAGIMVKSGAADLDIRSLLAARVKQARRSGEIGTSTVASSPRPNTDDRLPPHPERKKKKKEKEPNRERVKRKGSDDQPEASKKAKSLPESSPNRTIIVVPPPLMSRAFLSEDTPSESVIRSDLVSPFGQEFLSSLDGKTKWRLFCEVQARSLALAHHLAMEPLGEVQSLKQNLEEAEKTAADAISVNEEVTAKNRDLAAELDAVRRDNDTLRLELQKITNEGRRRLEEAETAYDTLKKQAQEKIVAQHEAGFKQAVRQAKHFGQFEEGFEFDMTKDFYQGSLISYADLPEGAELDDDPAPQAEDDVETSEENTLDEGHHDPTNDTEGNPDTVTGDESVRTPEE